MEGKERREWVGGEGKTGREMQVIFVDKARGAILHALFPISCGDVTGCQVSTFDGNGRSSC